MQIIQPILHSPDADCPHIARFEPYHFLALGSAVQTRAVTQLSLLAVTAAAASLGRKGAWLYDLQPRSALNPMRLLACTPMCALTIATCSSWVAVGAASGACQRCSAAGRFTMAG
jgi:hypothetical protein